MSDLQARITAAIDPHVETISGTEARDATDAVLGVFAAWLRERANSEHDPDCEVGRRELQHYPGEQVCAHFEARWRRDFATTLADEIAPRSQR